MANLVRNFIKGRMNKSVDERLVPNGEYIHAENIRMGSTEDSEIGAVENSKGNTQLTTLVYPPTGDALSANAVCIGAYADGARETMYWFVHDPSFTAVVATGKLDLIVSYNTTSDLLTYHMVSIDDGGGANTTLNFNPQYLITGVDMVDDLLFFTDDINPPRRINIGKNYAQPIANVDQFDALDILVIKAPPTNSPSIEPFNNGTDNNYMEELLICFAYRYRYEDSEYSATSQFSAPSYVSNQYEYSSKDFLNEGMVNQTNACRVIYNTGSSLVKGIDILFKEMDNPLIRVIEKIDKAEMGIADNVTNDIVFDNSKIFTVLPESEILRLYDNVPRLAKAQTTMGNRLVFGNYVEGYDINTMLEFDASLVSQEITASELSTSLGNGINYTIEPSTSFSITDARLAVDFAGVELVEGAILNFSVTLTHAAWSGTVSGWTPPYPSSETTDITVEFSYVLLQNYNSVTELYDDQDFKDKIGTVSNILPVYAAVGDTSCDGYTFTDLFNCSIPETQTGGTLSPVTKYESGITAAGQPILTSHSPGTTDILFQFPAMRYVANTGAPALNESVWEYYSITEAEVSYSLNGNTNSLRSNRSYEIGIVYMDSFGRSSTALVSPYNNVRVPCSNSDLSNRIRVNIPIQQVAPSWASQYKFVIKPDAQGYETIYSSIFFTDATDDATYFLLEGENSAKVEEGDRYIVKVDSGGAVNGCVYATVLEKKAQAAEFITPVVGVAADVPAGTYMKINANFNVVRGDDSIINFGPSTFTAFGAITAQYPINVSRNYWGITIPAGSRIQLKFEFERRGPGDGNRACERRTYYYDRSFVASQDYNDIVEWFEGDNIDETLNDGVADVGGDGCDIENVYLGSSATTVYPYGITPEECINYYTWIDNGVDTIFLAISGTRACNDTLGGTNRRQSSATIEINITRANNLVAFETIPLPALPDLWYESSVSYPITGGFHTGNVQNQTASDPAIVDTAFFNCIAYGNGVESYKIRDSIKGSALSLGNRVTTTNDQDYREIRRFADLTYSGVYNDETNVNKLNEFNLGLLNFKPLEDSYGPVEKLFGRRTDILTLQEDKISYVLAGKNLLTDSTGESVVTSVPEVLGTQVARIEDFGISNNPESFAEWGAHKFFTDAKRGAVIHLYGEGTGESLAIISTYGMRSWFRDMFIADFNTQKIGGYDPYMDEYVLANNERALPGFSPCIPCGTTQEFNLLSPGFSYCVNVGQTVGVVSVDYEVLYSDAAETATIITEYGGNPPVSTTGINIGNQPAIPPIVKDSVVNDSVDIRIDFSGVERFVIRITVSCPVADEITIVQVCVSNPSDAGETITNQYRWTDIDGYISPVHSETVKFASGSSTANLSGVISQYSTLTGFQGAGIIPSDTATVNLISRKLGDNTFTANSTQNNFAYLRSNTLYSNTDVDVDALLTAASNLAFTGSAPVYNNTFAMPASGDYLYLIWDYRSSTQQALCYDASTELDACCNCSCTTLCTEYLVSNAGSKSITVEYDDCGTGATVTTNIGGSASGLVCSRNLPRIISGDVSLVTILFNECNCT
jgi:hypothetical protein